CSSSRRIRAADSRSPSPCPCCRCGSGCCYSMSALPGQQRTRSQSPLSRLSILVSSFGLPCCSSVDAACAARGTPDDPTELSTFLMLGSHKNDAYRVETTVVDRYVREACTPRRIDTAERAAAHRSKLEVSRDIQVSSA